MAIIHEDRARSISTALLALLVILAVFVGIKSLNELRHGSYIDDVNRNVITVQGEGEAFAVPDTAMFTLTVQAEASTVEEAQAEVTSEGNEIIEFLRGEGVEEKNIKTIGYNVYPRYEYQQAGRGVSGAAEPAIYPPIYYPEGERVLVAYEVSHTLEVKVDDPDRAGELLSGVGALGADNVSGVSFTVEDEEEVMREARQKAIEDAREKAEQLARDLGVRLGDVVSFSENGGGYPIYYEKGVAYGRGGFDVAVDEAAPAPSLPTGENRVMSVVSITYEIK